MYQADSFGGMYGFLVFGQYAGRVNEKNFQGDQLRISLFYRYGKEKYNSVFEFWEDFNYNRYIRGINSAVRVLLSHSRSRRFKSYIPHHTGALAQLGVHRIRIAGVERCK